MKYIFVTGGVVSSLGKGLAAASIGTLLERGYSLANIAERSIYVALGKFKSFDETLIFITPRIIAGR